MRVLCKENNDIGSLEVIEIIDIGFSDFKDEYGERNRFFETGVTGLYFQDKENNYFYIKNISLSTCNDICKEILKTGYYDLSEYGQYESC